MLMAEIRLRFAQLILASRASPLMQMFCVLLSIGVGIGIFGESVDYTNYEVFFDDMRWDRRSTFQTSRFEEGFLWLTFLLVEAFPTDAMVFGIMALVSFWLKYFALSYYLLITKPISGYCRGNSALIIIAIGAAFYCSRFMPLHEFTQVRVGLATSFLLLYFVFFEKGRFPEAILAALVAFYFHQSVLFAIVVITIRPVSRRALLLYSPIIFIIIYSLFYRVLVDIGIGSKALILYQDDGFGTKANPFSLLKIIDVIMTMAGMLLWNSATEAMRKVLIAQVVGLLFFFALLDYPVMAFRIQEVFSVLWVFYVFDAYWQGYYQRVIASVFAVLCIAIYPYYYAVKQPIFT
jgi:hypothetical protein